MSEENGTSGAPGRPEGSSEAGRRVKSQLASLSRPRASAEFRSQLKDSFRTGAITPGFPSRPSRPVWIWPAVAVAAAALILFFFSPSSNPVEWKVFNHDGGVVSASSQLRVDGVLVDLRVGGDVPAFHPGDRIEYDGEGTLQILAHDLCAIEVASGTTLTLPHHESDVLRAQVARGTARFVTGPGFAGNTLWVTAQDVEIRVTGTTFSVLAATDKTCVSVFEGAVSVRDRNGQLSSVSSGNCRTIYLDSPRTEEHELSEQQRKNLTALFARSPEYFPR